MVSLARPFRPRPEHRPTSTAPKGASTRLRWLGTAGHVVETAATTLLLDPFLTRPGLLGSATRRLVPRPDLWWRHLPEHVDAVLVGHSHYDHLMDAPVIALRSGARIVGSATTCAFARAAGVPEENIDEVPPTGRTLTIGDVTVRFVPSLHGRFAAGRVPFPGEVRDPPRLPARIHHYRMGGAFGVHLTTPDTSLYHNGSADLVDAELEGLSAQVLLVGLAGRFATRDYLGRLTGLLRPEVAIPTHHDFFFTPLEDGPRLLPGVNLEGFFRELRDTAPGCRVVTPTYDDVVHVPDRVADLVVAAR